MRRFFFIFLLILATGCSGNGWQNMIIDMPAECGAAERVIVSAHHRTAETTDLQSWLEKEAASYCK